MTYRGHIKNGVAIIEAAVPLPDGTPVRVEVEAAGSDFWRRKSVSELAQEQGAHPVSDPSDLTIDWPAEDSLEDLFELVREARR